MKKREKMLSVARKEKQKEASPAYIDVDADPKHQDHTLLHTNKDIQALENNQILKDKQVPQLNQHVTLENNQDHQELDAYSNEFTKLQTPKKIAKNLYVITVIFV